MKKFFLIVTFIIIVVIGVIMASSKENNSSLYENMNATDEYIDATDNLMNSKDDIFQHEKNSKDDNAKTLVKQNCVADNLVYKEFTCGVYYDKGLEVLIEKDKITCETKSEMSLVVILDGNVYKEISLDNYENKDIEFTLEKSGYYIFLVIDADGNSVDISSAVMAMRLADEGAILLN